MSNNETYESRIEKGVNKTKVTPLECADTIDESKDPSWFRVFLPGILLLVFCAFLAMGSFLLDEFGPSISNPSPVTAPLHCPFDAKDVCKADACISSGIGELLVTKDGSFVSNQIGDSCCSYVIDYCKKNLSDNGCRDRFIIGDKCL